MEKSCLPSSSAAAAAAAVTSTSTAIATRACSTDRSSSAIRSSSAGIQNALRQLNKSSYKISKLSSGGGVPGGGEAGNPNGHKLLPPPLPPPAEATAASLPPAPPTQQPPPQPPVYNIHKSDFRDVVQKLTGSPAHHPCADSTPAALAPPPPSAGGGPATSSRLRKIRPPPLAQLATRPPPPLAPTGTDSNQPAPADNHRGSSAWWARTSPLSPLPPFPSVSAAAESPITAYMRCLRSGSQGLLPSPRSGSTGGLLLPPTPSSPLGFGCVPSPRSAFLGLLPPALLFPPSPTASPR